MFVLESAHLPIFVEHHPLAAVHQLVRRVRGASFGGRSRSPQLGLLRVGRLAAVHPERAITA